MRYVRQHVRWLLVVALALGLMLMLPGSALAHGGSKHKPKHGCPTSLIAKFDVEKGEFVLRGGTDGAITIFNVLLDDDEEPAGFEWSSTTDVGSVIVKGGRQVKTFSGDDTVIDFDSPPAISNVKFCAPEETDDEADDDEAVEDETVEETTDDDAVDETTDDETVVEAVDDSGTSEDIPVPTRVDTGAGGVTGPSFTAVMTVVALFTLVAATFAGVAARLRRRHG